MMPDWNEALEEVCAGNIDVRPIVGEVIRVDGVPEALRRAQGAGAPPRIIVSYQ
jgi:threonine dehydrogenase-like Zn-dependent dehydrogenase